MRETLCVGACFVRLHAPMCPQFHFDRATVRLVCT
jgi:hypothetical protein